MKYILEAKSCESNEICVLCDKPQSPMEKDKENYVLYRGEHCYIMLNLYPYTNGHIMVVPYLHEGDLTRMDEGSLREMGSLMRVSVAALSRLMQPTGFNIGMNLGRVAGAGIAEHLHMHVVPRWQGDTNFMSVLGETRMIPEDLDETYEKLRPLLLQEVSKSNMD